MAEESLSVEVVSEVEEDVVDATFLSMATAAGLGAVGSESLSDDDEVSEEEETTFLGVIVFTGTAADFGDLTVGLLLECEFGEGEACLGVGSDFNFLAGAGFSSLEESESESELEEELELAFRFKLLVAAGTDDFALVGSCSSSASLSELELEVDERDFACDHFVALILDFIGVTISFISTSESLPLLLCPLFTITFLVAFILASLLTFPCLCGFSNCPGFMWFESPSSPPMSLLLVSSSSALSSYPLCHSLKSLTRLGNPLGSLTPI